MRKGSLREMADSSAIERLKRLGHGLPGVEEGTSYGTPALKVGKHLLVRVKDEDTLVLRCPIEEKEALMAVAGDIYFETAHYVGWPYVLASARVISDAELALRIEAAWRRRAGRKLIAMKG